MKFFDWLLQTPDKEKRHAGEIIMWWELRRIPYNLFMIVGTIISLSLMAAVIRIPDGADLVEPIMVLLLFFGGNICYTFGWVVELFTAKGRTFGPAAWRAGFWFTMFWVFLPGIVHISWWVLRGFTIMEFDY